MPRPSVLLFRLATFALVSAALFAVTPAPAAATSLSCDDPSHLCLDPVDGAKWQPDGRTTRRQRKRRGRGKNGTLSLGIENGRGSLFLNGRYAGTAPIDGVPIPSGANDIQVRDGMVVLATGVLTVPRGESLTITVRHP